MKLLRKGILFASFALALFVLAACQDKVLEFRFVGIEDIEVENGAPFNILDNVKVLDQDDKEYTGITFVTVSKYIDEDGKLDTKFPGESKVRYEFVNGEVKLQQWRTINVARPEKVEGQLLQNGDFADGVLYWEGDQGSIDLSVTDGVLQADIIAGANAHEPRLTQMEIPFEFGKVYEIKFEGKSSVDKLINLQVGELLPAAPWFVNFKTGQEETAMLTTEWNTFSYKFKHNIENDRGGVLFEFGKFGGLQIDSTVWLRNITIEESDLGEDLNPPAITGIEDVVLLVGSEFDVLAGVNANDQFDGDVTANLEVTIKNEADEVIEAIDKEVVGIYTITYTVTDLAGNVAEETRIVEYQQVDFSEENLVVNGDFSEELGPEWANWFGKLADDENAFPSDNEGTVEIVDGKLNIDVTAIAGADYGIQLNHTGITLVEGERYLLEFKISSSVARTIRIALGESFDVDPYFDSYYQTGNFDITTVEETYSFSFVNTKTTNDNIKIEFNFGNIENPPLSLIVLDDVRLSPVLKPLLVETDFTKGTHEVSLGDGDAFGTAVVEAEKITVNVTNPGAAAHEPHYFFSVDKLEVGTYVYKITVKTSVSRTLRFNVVNTNGWASLLQDGSYDFEVEAGVEFELQLEFEIGTRLTDLIKFELDFGPIEGYESDVQVGTYEITNVDLVIK